MDAATAYAEKITQTLAYIRETQMDNIHAAARLAADAVAADGIIYTFGTGHSHVIAEDVAYRAGGLAPVDAILEPSLTGHTQVYKSEFMERVEGMAQVILDYYEISERDCLIVISNSGRNAAPVEMAEIARSREIPVIAITSLQHSKGTESRLKSGKKLYEVADVVIDNGAPYGDALVQLEGLVQPVGPASGVAGLFILHALMTQTVQELLNRGIDPPVFRSGNLDGSTEFNQKYMDRYKGRIKLW